MKIDVKFKRLKDDVMLPEKATSDSAGYDLYTPDYTIVKKGRSIIPLGFQMSLPSGYKATINPRSGNTSKGLEAITLPNFLENASAEDIRRYSETVFGTTVAKGRYDADIQQGTCDADYRGEYGVMIVNHSGQTLILNKHQRFAQLFFEEVIDANFGIVDTLDETERDGGFGHSGSEEM